MNLHPTLARQVHRAYPGEPPAELAELLGDISQTYAGFDEDRALIERSLVVSSQELDDRIRQLQQAQNELELQKASIEQAVELRTHQLTETQAELQASIRALPFGFAFVSPNHRIVFHNQALEELVGFVIPREARQTNDAFRRLADYFGQAINLVEETNRVITERTRLERQITLGASFFRIIVLPILTPADQTRPAIGSVLLVENITDVKAQERSRDEFFSIASHELRTPLTAIKGNSSMILEYYGNDVDDPDLHKMVEDMHESSARLIAIVNDFLSASRLEQGKMVFKIAPFNIYELAVSVVEEYAGAVSTGVELAFTGDVSANPLVMADADRVRQIVVNLVTNSLKFTNHGGVSVSLEALTDTMRLRVADSGRGIPVESQHLLFRKFQQATNNILTRDNTKGTGLGLYISQLMAEGMKGRLFLERTEMNHGSTFALDLPIAPAPTSYVISHNHRRTYEKNLTH